MRDLHEIRAETFKKSTIHSAFEKAGMWPISCKAAIAKMKVYSPLEPLIELPTLPRTPTRFQHAEDGLRHWRGKLSERLSSPSRESFNSWARGTERVLAGGELAVLQHKALATKVHNQQKAKYHNRNVLQKHGVLTAEEAIAKKEANQAKRQAITDKKNATLVRVTRNKIKNELKTRGIAARRLERERKKQVELLQKAKEFVPLQLLEPILDPELSVIEADIELQLRERLISNPAALGLKIDSILGRTQTTGSPSSRGVLGINVGDDFTVQSDYIPFLGLGNKDFMEWDYLDADEDAEINLF